MRRKMGWRELEGGVGFARPCASGGNIEELTEVNVRMGAGGMVCRSQKGELFVEVRILAELTELVARSLSAPEGVVGVVLFASEEEEVDIVVRYATRGVIRM